MELIPCFKFDNEVTKTGIKYLKITQKHSQDTKCSYCTQEFGILLKVILRITNSVMVLTAIIIFILSAW